MVDLRPWAVAKCGDSDPDVQFWSAWSAALLGEPQVTITLRAVAMAGGPHAERAAELAARCMALPAALDWHRELAHDPIRLRLATIVAGAAGDPALVAWLIGLMNDDELARPAGEALSTITGVDLAYDNLERDLPEEVAAGPTDDPADEDVALDDDENLPWPDQQLVATWWQSNASCFDPGTRYLLGRPITLETLPEALATGRQRQRAAAALELSLHQPGRPLFEVRAPGFRQRRQLAGS